MKQALEIGGIRLLLNERLILSDVFLKVETGDIVGLLGRNGEGKSCLMRITFGVLAAEKSVSINNVLLHEAYKKPQLIRYLPQHNFIPKYLSLKHIFKDFDVDFSVFSDLFPEFRNRENTKIGHLSGGMFRIVELYVILKSDTQFVLLDEPFTHISPLQIDIIKNLIREESAQKGILITDHLHRHITDVCGRVYALSNGKTHLITQADDLKKLGYITS